MQVGRAGPELRTQECREVRLLPEPATKRQEMRHLSKGWVERVVHLQRAEGEHRQQVCVRSKGRKDRKLRKRTGQRSTPIARDAPHPSVVCPRVSILEQTNEDEGQVEETRH